MKVGSTSAAPMRMSISAKPESVGTVISPSPCSEEKIEKTPCKALLLCTVFSVLRFLFFTFSFFAVRDALLE